MGSWGHVALVASLLLTVGTVGNASSAPGRHAAEARPNILLVMTDDQTFESLRSMPSLQTLAASGTTFTDYHANFAVCCPSRVTVLTGQYVHNHGVWTT